MISKYFDINESGCSIRCKLYCVDPHAVKRVIVFCHGFAGHKDTKSAETFAARAVTKRKGTAVVVFDWPAHGEDARKNLLLEDCDEYLSIVIAYAREHFGTDELYAYGTSFGGLSALLSMLNSCASGVSVVNIDNGFGAGYLASMINHL